MPWLILYKIFYRQGDEGCTCEIYQNIRLTYEILTPFKTKHLANRSTFE